VLLTTLPELSVYERQRFSRLAATAVLTPLLAASVEVMNVLRTFKTDEDKDLIAGSSSTDSA